MKKSRNCKDCPYNCSSSVISYQPTYTQELPKCATLVCRASKNAQCRVASMMSIFSEKTICPLTPITMCFDDSMQHQNTRKLRCCGEFLNPIIIPYAGTNLSSHSLANGSLFKKRHVSLLFSTNRRASTGFNDPPVANGTSCPPVLS